MKGFLGKAEIRKGVELAFNNPGELKKIKEKDDEKHNIRFRHWEKTGECLKWDELELIYRRNKRTDALF